MTRLIARPGPDAGIFLTNLPSAGWLSYDALRAKRDDLIMVLLTGNRNGSSAIDYTVHPATGFPAITGPAGTGPVNSVLPAWDIAAGLHAAVGLLAAERQRSRTGQGRAGPPRALRRRLRDHRRRSAASRRANSASTTAARRATTSTAPSAATSRRATASG